MRISTLLALLTICLLSGCTPLYYPSPLQMPIAEKAGQASVVVYGGLNDLDKDVPKYKLPTDFTVQAGYGITNKLTLCADYTSNTPSRNMVLDTRRRFGNLGIMYKLYQDSTEGAWRMDWMAGLGQGQTSNFHFDNLVRQSDFWKPWLQVRSEGGNKQHIRAGFAIQASYILCPNYWRVGGQQKEFYSFLEVEAAAQVNVHFGHAHLLGQAGIAGHLGKIPFYTNMLFINVGAGFTLGVRR